ncbi:thiol:disulfide interchange protein DsbC [Psychromonas ingrahamii 37]|uniref:Thiol:disulfide interchange protein n=1 Tax=Psychromonas ingrahamii (strain DSM 17664 / CCUG 51855 / 37) TaxID=357804 RepID=A1SZS5_PSYIN|nr:bifunctional protein-disulfide isomerase/oxidoreductase DsbC [Psychromonas ingrahamii]ABM04990.1 thiol:disulfide interchange protein DsbC [Psychromonas ingrahamii 37]
MATIFSKTGVICVFLLSSFAAVSATSESPSSLVVEEITTKMESLKIPVNEINKSAVEGLYEVISNGDIYYISEDATHLLYGSIYALDNQMVNITEQKKAQLSRQKVAKNIDKITAFEKDMIVFKAQDEKHVVTVFTDPTCSYCQKLHSQMADYNKLGITIRYLAFPRAGIDSSTYHTMVSIWCSNDPKNAMNMAKKRREIPSETCENTVKEQYQLGRLLGVNGTPALILENGTLTPGYLPPQRLLQLLEEK